MLGNTIREWYLRSSLSHWLEPYISEIWRREPNALDLAQQVVKNIYLHLVPFLLLWQRPITTSIRQNYSDWSIDIGFVPQSSLLDPFTSICVPVQVPGWMARRCPTWHARAQLQGAPLLPDCSELRLFGDYACFGYLWDWIYKPPFI